MPDEQHGGPEEAAAIREQERQVRITRIAEIDALIDSADQDGIITANNEQSIAALWREKQNLLPYI